MSQEILDKKIEEQLSKLGKWTRKEKLSNSDKFYVGGVLGVELIGTCLTAVKEEDIGIFLDDIMKMIKDKVKLHHPAFNDNKEDK